MNGIRVFVKKSIWQMVFRVEFAVFFTRNSKVNFILERRLQSKIYDSYLESEVFRVIN